MMNREIEYMDYDEVLNVYHKMIVASNGGFEGVREEGGIRAVLNFVRNDDYYPSFPLKLAYIIFSFCRGHYFNDGNKRIALTLAAYWLHKNGYIWHACIIMARLESIVYHVAASNINRELLQRIVVSFMSEPDYSEELQIDILNAMKSGNVGISEDSSIQD